MKLQRLFRRRAQRERELEEEIRAHLAMAIRDRIEQGEGPAEAEANARREFGNVPLVKEVTRDRWRWIWFESLIQDFRYGLRQLRRNPGFTAVAIITLALGIGANTAMFTVVRAVLLKPLSYSNPDRLVRITGGATPVRFEEIKATARSYTEIGAFAGGMENVTLSGSAEPEALKGARVSAKFLRILGVSPLLGRSFLPQEDKLGGPPVAMISANLWRRRFGSDPRIAGKTVAFNLTPYTIIGVLPADFAFPFPDVDVWLTRPSEWSVIPPQSRPLSPVLGVFGRLRARISLKQADAELAVLNHQYALTHPRMLDAKPHLIERVAPLKGQLVSSVRSMLWMLFGAAGFVLLFACANVASLLMARAAFRSREFTLRAARYYALGMPAPSASVQRTLVVDYRKSDIGLLEVTFEPHRFA
ncbi:MAG: ABC transporter permease [Terriglobia bacterium]